MLLDALGDALAARSHDVVAREMSPERALAAVDQYAPDACLLDFSYPRGTCLEVLRTMALQHQGTRVVVFSGQSDPQIVGGLLAAGASGFVSKSKSIDEICQVLDRAVSGQIAVEPRLLQEILRGAGGQNPLWTLRFLTDREWEVLRCITLGRATKEIARDLHISEATARTHVQNLMAKLRVHSRLEAAALMTRHATPETWPARLRS